MDVSKILAELKAERAQIEEAILSLERLALGRKRGPGRPRSIVPGESSSPTGSSAPVAGIGIKRRGRPPGSKNKPKVAEASTSPLTASAGSH